MNAISNLPLLCTSSCYWVFYLMIMKFHNMELHIYMYIFSLLGRIMTRSAKTSASPTTGTIFGHCGAYLAPAHIFIIWQHIHVIWWIWTFIIWNFVFTFYTPYIKCLEKIGASCKTIGFFRHCGAAQVVASYIHHMALCNINLCHTMNMKVHHMKLHIHRLYTG